MTYFCDDIRRWLNRWAKGRRDESLRRLRQRLGALAPTEACLHVLRCVQNSYEADTVEITPLLLWEIYKWHRQVPNKTQKQLWFTLRRFIHRRLTHYHTKVKKSALLAVEDAFCYGRADRRRLFLQKILHSDEDIWITVSNWVEFVGVDDLLRLLLQKTPWRKGTAWNVLFALDFLVDDMDEGQKGNLTKGLHRVFRFVDGLCLVEQIDTLALWKICETVNFHIGGAEAIRLLQEVASECRSKVVKQKCLNALRDLNVAGL